MRNVALLAEPNSDVLASFQTLRDHHDFDVVLCSSPVEFLYRLTLRCLHPTVALANLDGAADLLLPAFTLWPLRHLPPLPPMVLWTPGGEDAVADYLPFLTSFPLTILPAPVNPHTAIAVAIYQCDHPHPHYASAYDQIRRGVDCTARDSSHRLRRRI